MWWKVGGYCDSLYVSHFKADKYWDVSFRYQRADFRDILIPLLYSVIRGYKPSIGKHVPLPPTACRVDGEPPVSAIRSLLRQLNSLEGLIIEHSNEVESLLVVLAPQGLRIRASAWYVLSHHTRDRNRFLRRNHWLGLCADGRRQTLKRLPQVFLNVWNLPRRKNFLQAHSTTTHLVFSLDHQHTPLKFYKPLLKRPYGWDT